MEQLIQAVYSLEDLCVVKDLINRLPRTDIEEPDSEGLDLLHHVILVNYGEVVQYLLLRGCFGNLNQRNARPSYIHLSSLLGHGYIISLLLEACSSDYFSKVRKNNWINWNALETAIEKRVGDENKVRLQSTLLIARAKMQNCEGDEEFLPLDIAAITGHTNAVKLLLTTTHSKLESKCLLESAVKLNSPRTLSLMLNSEKHDKAVLDEAVRAALRRKEPECLKLLLKHGANIVQVFHGLNPFHVMYMYSSGYWAPNTPSRHTGIDECTSVLISFKQDVNAKIPFGSYPLYSIIHSIVYEKDEDPNRVPDSHLNAFELLLEAGADPNFNEVEYTYTVHDDSHMLTIGRDLFTSALNAFFISLQASDTWRACMKDHLDDCCLLLLKYGANPDYTDSYGETPLHDLMKLWAMQHALGHMHVDLTNMASMLLKYGADPNLQSSNGLYPVHYYFKILFNLMGGLIAYERWKKVDTPTKVLRLLRLMKTENASEAYEKILKSCAEAQEEGMPDTVTEFISNHIKDIMLEPRTLQSMCQFQIWESCKRKISSLDKLPLPNRHIAELQSLFDPIEL